MVSLFEVPPISEQQHEQFLNILFHNLRGYVAGAIEREFMDELRKVFDEKLLVVVPKQRMRQLEEMEKFALSSLNIHGNLIIGKANKNDNS